MKITFQRQFQLTMLVLNLSQSPSCLWCVSFEYVKGSHKRYSTALHWLIFTIYFNTASL